jgi:hypothetical protein
MALEKLPSLALDRRLGRRRVTISLDSAGNHIAINLFVCSNFEVDYGSEEYASIVYKTLAVDKEVNKANFLILGMSPASMKSSHFLFVRIACM